jgi:hypothetical protein
LSQIPKPLRASALQRDTVFAFPCFHSPELLTLIFVLAFAG